MKALNDFLSQPGPGCYDHKIFTGNISLDSTRRNSPRIVFGKTNKYPYFKGAERELEGKESPDAFYNATLRYKYQSTKLGFTPKAARFVNSSFIQEH